MKIKISIDKENQNCVEEAYKRFFINHKNEFMKFIESIKKYKLKELPHAFGRLFNEIFSEIFKEEPYLYVKNIYVKISLSNGKISLLRSDLCDNENFVLEVNPYPLIEFLLFKHHPNRKEIKESIKRELINYHDIIKLALRNESIEEVSPTLRLLIYLNNIKNIKEDESVEFENVWKFRRNLIDVARGIKINEFSEIKGAGAAIIKTIKKAGNEVDQLKEMDTLEIIRNYENACEVLGIPKEKRLITIDFYKEVMRISKRNFNDLLKREGFEV